MGILFIIMHSYKLGSDNNANQNIKDLTPIREGLKKFPVKNQAWKRFVFHTWCTLSGNFGVIKGRLKPALQNEISVTPPGSLRL